MLWLDEDLRSDAQTPTPGRAKGRLDVSLYGNGVQHYSIEGICVDGVDSGAIAGQKGAYTVTKGPHGLYWHR